MFRFLPLPIFFQELFVTLFLLEEIRHLQHELHAPVVGQTVVYAHDDVLVLVKNLILWLHSFFELSFVDILDPAPHVGLK